MSKNPLKYLHVAPPPLSAVVVERRNSVVASTSQLPCTGLIPAQINTRAANLPMKGLIVFVNPSTAYENTNSTRCLYVHRGSEKQAAALYNTFTTARNFSY